MHLFPPSTSDSVPVSRPRQKVAVQQRAQHVVQDTIRDKHPPETEPTRPPGVPSWALGGLLLALLFQQAQRHVPVERGAGRAEEAGGDLRRVSCCDFCVYVHLFVRRACLSVGRMRMCTYGDAHATTGTCTRAPGRAPPEALRPRAQATGGGTPAAATAPLPTTTTGRRGRRCLREKAHGRSGAPPGKSGAARAPRGGSWAAASIASTAGSRRPSGRSGCGRRGSGRAESGGTTRNRRDCRRYRGWGCRCRICASRSTVWVGVPVC